MCTKVSSCRKGRAYFEFETSKGQEGLREGLEGQEGSLDLVSKREVADDTAREQRELLLDGHGRASLRAHALWKEAGYTGCGDLGVLGDRDADPWRVRPQERRPHLTEFLGQLLYQGLHGVSHAQHQS